MEIFQYISVLFSAVWELFSIDFPGTNISFGAIGMGALSITLSLRLIGVLTGAHFSISGAGNSIRMRGANNRKIKISEARKYDQS